MRKKPTDNNRKLMGALALARKAGKLKAGAEIAQEVLLKGAPLALVSSDVSDRTLRNITRAAKRDLIKLPVTQYEIHSGIGVRFAAAAVTDENFSKLILSSLNEEA